MDEARTEQSRLIRTSAEDFAGEAKRQGLLDRTSVKDGASWFGALAKAGWTGLLVAEGAGGSGLGASELCLVAEELGRKILPTSFVPAAVGAAALATPPSPGLRDRLRRCLAGEIAVLVALDPEDAAEPSLLADRRDDGAIMLAGTKRAVIDAEAAAGFVVDARLEGETVLLFAPSPAAGLSIGLERMIDGDHLGALSFHDMRLPPDCVIARGAEAVALGERMRLWLELGAAAGLVGLALEVFDRTLDYMRTRRAFGRPIAGFQALQHRAVDTYAEIELARALVAAAAEIAAAPRPGTRAAAAASFAKASQIALATAKWAVQMHGAMGFTDACDIGLFLKRALAVSRCHRAPEAPRRIVARASGKEALFQAFRSESAADADFRQEVRDWLEANLPTRLRDLPTRPSAEDALWWHRQLHARGWIAPHWPKALGGMDASVEQQIILAEELARIGAPELSGQAIHHIGPILIRFGTEEQKRLHLGPMVTGDCVWCQGYSEPGAGSDLAAIRTTAAIEGDELVVSGQKVWTTWAHHAQWMFALVRTDPAAANPRDGISMVLIDMTSPGLAVRPIRTIAGDEEFAEVFFDAVRVPRANVVGALHGGWKIAHAVLEAERLGNATPQRAVVVIDRVRRVARRTGANLDPAFADRLAAAEIDLLSLCAAHSRVLASVRAGEAAGPRASVLKLAGCELQQRIADLMVEAGGSDAALLDPIVADDRRVDIATSFLQVRRATIFGGTSEIQRNIIARRILDLGSEARKG